VAREVTSSTYNQHRIYLSIFISLYIYLSICYITVAVYKFTETLHWPFALLVSHREGRNVLDGNGCGMITNNQSWKRIMQHDPYSVTFLQFSFFVQNACIGMWIF